LILRGLNIIAMNTADISEYTGCVSPIALETRNSRHI